MENAIKIAIENGYVPKPTRYKYGSTFDGTCSLADELFDPLFWQALGKGLGWGEYVCTLCGTKELKSEDNSPLYCPTDMCYSVQKEYRFIWHRFIDHLASGGEIDKFFKDLTSGTAS